jgi:GT2 family glycosyltransferase
MDAHPGVAIASPALADADGGNARAAVHALPSAARVVAELLRLHKLLPARRRAQLLQGAYWPVREDSVDVGWVPGTAMIIRREAAEQVGLPDEDFFLYGEDIDWCWRMHKAGWRIGYCGSVVVRHAESDTTNREYGASNTQLRIAKTELEATRRGRGRARAALYGAAVVLALAAESLNPRRTSDARRRTRALSKAWATALRGSS